MHFKDQTQNFWQLACITGMALGLPGMVVGGKLATQFGAGTALVSVLIGNFILWMIGLAITSMAQNRNHAIENVKGYLGKNTSILAALIWIFSFLFWYIVQIKASANGLNESFQYFDSWKIGLFLGLLVAFLSIGGIHLLKWFCVAAFPLLFIYAVYLIIMFGQFAIFKSTWAFSFSCILTVVLTWLPGAVNLPTFFRHSRSKADSILGLTLMTIFHIFFQFFSILTNIENSRDLATFNSFTPVSFAIDILFSLTAYICINLVNVYLASAGWETIIPKYKSYLVYLMVGLLGTGVYIIFQSPQLTNTTNDLPEFIEAIFVSLIANLTIVLLIACIVRIVVRHRPRSLEKFWNSVCWLIGCLTTAYTLFQNNSDFSHSLIAGIVASTVCLLVVIFIEEAIWSIKILFKNNAFFKKV